MKSILLFTLTLFCLTGLDAQDFPRYRGEFVRMPSVWISAGTGYEEGSAIGEPFPLYSVGLGVEHQNLLLSVRGTIGRFPFFNDGTDQYQMERLTFLVGYTNTDIIDQDFKFYVATGFSYGWYEHLPNNNIVPDKTYQLKDLGSNELREWMLPVDLGLIINLEPRLDLTANVFSNFFGEVYSIGYLMQFRYYLL